MLDFLQNTPFYDPYMIALLIIVGFGVGFVNTIAGMATVISYWLFMAMGLPINVANGTTRFGVLVQFAVSSLIYKKEGVLDIKEGTKVGIPVCIGAAFGAYIAAVMEPRFTEFSMGVLMPLIGLLLILDGTKFNKRLLSYFNNLGGKGGSKHNIIQFILFIFVGVYGGFTHAGVGLLVIFGCMYLMGTDMLKGNAIKQFAVVLYTPIALSVFIYYGQIHWGIAIIYSIGNTLGAILASKVSIKMGSKFIKICVFIVVVIMSIWLIFKNI